MMTVGQDRYHKLISSLRVSKFVLTKIKQEVSRKKVLYISDGC